MCPRLVQRQVPRAMRAVPEGVCLTACSISEWHQHFFADLSLCHRFCLAGASQRVIHCPNFIIFAEESRGRNSPGPSRQGVFGLCGCSAGCQFGSEGQFEASHQHDPLPVSTT